MDRRTVGIAVMLGTLALTAWGGVVSHGTVYEDPRWQEAATSPLGWRARPISVLSWRLLADAPLAVQHGVSLALHGVNAALVGRLAMGLGLSAGGAWLAAAVFLLHPLQAEAVNYLSARAELLATGAVLLACLASLERRWGWTLLAAAVACLSKESAIVVVALVPLLAGASAMAVTALVGLWWLLAILSLGVLHQPVTLAWIAAQLMAAGRLLTQVVWPSALSVDYAYASASVAQTLTWLGLSLAMCGLAVWRRSVGLGWVAMVVAYRTAVVTPGSLLNEHQWYLAMVGIALAVASWRDQLLEGARCPR